jgi:hypothetical protein
MRILLLLGLSMILLGAATVAPLSPVGTASAAPCHQTEDGQTVCECPPPPPLPRTLRDLLGPECT